MYMVKRNRAALAALTAWTVAIMTALLIATPARAKDGVAELIGAVSAMPASGLVGNWTIAGRNARADTATVFKQELGRLAVGALVEAKANILADSSLLLTVVEVKQGVGGPTSPPVGIENDVTGAIETLPAGTLLGTWRVAGRSVLVVSTTLLDQQRGGFAVGATVEVKGTPNAAGVIVASRIEVKAGGSTTVRPPEAAIEVLGTVESLPESGLLGTWRISGRPVVVGAATVLNSEHGAFVVGSSVEAKGSSDGAGNLLTTRIERIPGNGAPVPPLKFWATIEKLPGVPGFLGLWTVAGKLVNVTANTTLRVNNGPLTTGAIVEVSGWLQADGVIEAQEIETRSSVGALAGQGSDAVEFFNARLGHFFVTAFPPEIANLDAGAFGGEWKRTGQSFKVGNATGAVCRFYGAPPKGPDSHFFTADPAECANVMQQYQAWTFEAHAFSIAPAVNGACPAGLIAVHRFYNNPTTGGEMNHRYTVTQAAFDDTVARGWMHEGVVMCAQP
jgi:hypothetical protein